MRRVSKIQLLLAPVLLAASVGCSSTGHLTGKATGAQCIASSHSDRTDRMMQIAAQYEQAGKPELAYKLYKHLSAQDSDNLKAKERMEFIAQGKFSLPDLENAPHKPLEHDLKTNEQLAEIESPQMQDALLVQVNNNVIPKSPLPIQEAEDIDWDGITARTHQREELAAAKETPKETPKDSSTKLPAIYPQGAFEKQPVAQVEKTPVEDETAWWTEVFEEGANEAAVVQSNGADDVKSDQPETVQAETVIVQELAIWTQEPLTVSTASEPETASEWAPTSLARYCPGLPATLHPQMHKLDSSNVVTRISGLQEIRRMGTEGEPVERAVRVCMVDDNPLVKAHAAGALHFISGETRDSTRALVNVLDSDAPEAVCLAAYLLGKIGPKAVSARPQLEIVRDRNDGLSSLYAAEALTRISSVDEYSFEKLTIALFGDNEDARWFAAVSLGVVSENHGYDAANVLREALRDGSSSVRAAAALSLGGLGENARIAIADLRHAAMNDNQEVRDAATMALACIEL